MVSFQSQSEGLRPRRADGVKFQMNVADLGPRKMLQFKLKGRKNCYLNSEVVRQELPLSFFCSNQACRGFVKVHPHQAGRSARFSLLMQMLVSSSQKHPYRAPRIMSDQKLGKLMAQSSRHIITNHLRGLSGSNHLQTFYFFCLIVLSSVERWVLKTSCYDNGVDYFSFQFCQFLLPMF